MSTDFIVIGSGLAGLTSSLILSKYGRVLIITKAKLTDTATNWAQGGIACAVGEGDSWNKHFADTLAAGSYFNDKGAVEYLVKNAKDAIEWLSKQGVPFEKSGGKYKTGKEGGHGEDRILHATDITGREIEKTLINSVKKNKSITIWEDTFVSDLLVDNKICFGVRTVDKLPPKRKFVKEVFGRCVVLATGGLGQLYQWTTNPPVSTGDGIALSFRAGAKMRDLEFIQFHPTAFKNGKSPLFLLSEALRGEGAYLVKIKNTNKNLKIKNSAERFMEDYDKRGELAPRDIVARAIYSEQQKGYEVFLDIRHKGKDFLIKRFPNIYRELQKRGFDMAKNLIPITPVAHYSCGGVEVDKNGRTSIKNLFAFGEVACTGVHGANRLASNSLLEAVVFPLRLIEHSQNLLRSVCFFPHLPSSPRQAGLRAVGVLKKHILPANSYHLLRMRNNLQKLMWERIGIVRTKDGMQGALGQIKKWEKELEGIEGNGREFMEIKNMVLVAKLITESALKRKKSLGAHFVIS